MQYKKHLVKLAVLLAFMCGSSAHAQVPAGCYVEKPLSCECSSAYIGEATLGTVNGNVSFFGPTVGLLVTEFQQTREILNSAAHDLAETKTLLAEARRKIRAKTLIIRSQKASKR